MKTDCILKACERKQFFRTFKREVLGDDPGILLDRIKKTMEERITAYIALANKAGKVVSGSDMVSDTLKRRSSAKKLVLIAIDASEDIAQKIRCLSEACGTGHFSLFTKECFGAILGKSQRSVIAVQGNGFVEALNTEIERYRNFLRGEGCAE
jgi:ribosomal protein L7Ae-like RNA K-turn-binding protein